MKILSSALLLPAILAEDLWDDSIDFTDGFIDDEEVDKPLWSFDRGALAAGGTCDLSTKREVFNAFDSTFHNFLTARRHRLHDNPMLLSLPGVGVEDQHPFRWNGIYDHKNRFYTKLRVDDYDGKVTLYNTNNDLKMVIKPLGNAKYNLDNVDRNRGFFYVQKTKDENYLNFEYGNRHFTPLFGVILTWLFVSDKDTGCPSENGNSFQVVLLIANNKQRRSRVIFNYGPIKDATIGSPRPLIGFEDLESGEVRYHPHMDGDDSGTADDLSFFDYKRLVFTELFDPITELHNPPHDPKLCAVIEHCHCLDIRTAPELTWDLDLDNDVEFTGRCSITPETYNYGGVEYLKRGHECYVKPKSDSCSANGYQFGVFAQTSSVADGGALTTQAMITTTFHCIVDHDNQGSAPYWERTVLREDKRLQRDLYILNLGQRKLVRAAAKKNRKWRARFSGSKKNKGVSKWQKRQSRKAARASASKRKSRIADNRAQEPFSIGRRLRENTVLECGFTCSHPDNWDFEPQYMDRNLPEANFNIDRNGSWDCYDSDGNGLTPGEDLPYGGYCFLTCPGTPSYGDVPQSIRCRFFDKVFGSRQYEHYRQFDKFVEDNSWVCPT